jgi:AcrR family transcriptional regulator
MKVKNLNHSSEKTKKLIKNTFAELVNEYQELNKVTVSELVKRADINRGTFYNHYDSIYDVAEEFESDLIKVLFEDSKNLHSIDDFFKYLDYIKEYLKNNEDTYKLLVSSKEPFIFLDRLSSLITNKLHEALSSNSKLAKSKTLKFNIDFFTFGVISQVLEYFKETSEYSLDEICEYSKELFKKCFSDVL